MEREVLRVLDFDLTQPTIKTFLRRYIKAASGAPPGGRWVRAACGDVALQTHKPTISTLEHQAVPLHAVSHALRTRGSQPPALQPCLPSLLPTPALPGPAVRAGEIPLDVTFEFLCSYLAELTLMEYGMLNYLPSMVAASCVTVALLMLGKPHWTATLSHYSGYLPRDLRHCAQVCWWGGRLGVHRGRQGDVPCAHGQQPSGRPGRPAVWGGSMAPTCIPPRTSPHPAGRARAVCAGQDLQPAGLARQVRLAQVRLGVAAGLPRVAARVDVPVSTVSQAVRVAVRDGRPQGRPPPPPSAGCGRGRAAEAPPRPPASNSFFAAAPPVLP